MPAFLYCVLLILRGIEMLVIGVLRNQPTARHVIRIVVGLGFISYGFYLAFIFQGGRYSLFFQAFIVPILVIVDALRTNAARRRLRARQSWTWRAASGASGPAGSGVGAGTAGAVSAV